MLKIGYSGNDLVLHDDFQQEFNCEKPFKSIELFFNGRHFLQNDDVCHFISQMEAFFKQMAFQGKHVAIPDLYKDRFSHIYLPMILEDRLKVFKEANDDDVRRLLATIEKITSIHFSLLSRKYQIATFEIENPIDSEVPLATTWGWVCSEDEKNVRVLITLGSALRVLTTCQNQVRPFDSPLDDEKPISASGLSPFFNPQKPFKSIARFVDHFSFLNNKEHNQLFHTIMKFFLNKAAKNQSVDIPPKYIKRFSVLDLKFLMDHFPANTNTKNYVRRRHRLIAAIQKVTQKRFLQIPENDQLYVTVCRTVDFPKGHYGWLRKSFVDDTTLSSYQKSGEGSVLSYVDCKPIQLDGINHFQSLVLEQLQYPAVNETMLKELDAYVRQALEGNRVSAEFLSEVFELIYFAEIWEMQPLQSAIVTFIKSQPYFWKDSDTGEFREFSTVCGRHLKKEGVNKFLNRAGITYLKPEKGHLNQDEQLAVLEFNIKPLHSDDYEDYKRLVKDVLGPELFMFHEIKMFAMTKRKSQLEWAIWKCILDGFNFRLDKTFRIPTHIRTIISALMEHIYRFSLDVTDVKNYEAATLVEFVKRFGVVKSNVDPLVKIFSSEVIVEFFHLVKNEEFRLFIINSLPACFK